tara:strand:- start:349 stop:1068 length:720 start_codon:yes stop_codon:yes gene_type:complete
MIEKHSLIEKNATLLLVFCFLVVTIGGIIEIIPLFYIENTIEKVNGMRPYTPLELSGRNIYIREGCNSCHSQMIRPLRDEVERYGHYSLAAESKYDHPFLWGSKRTGPDLARIGERYSDKWHVDHLINPQSLVPGSVMPGYSFLATQPLETKNISALLKINKFVGVPYTDAMISNAKIDLLVQADPESETENFEDRYPGASIRNFDGNSEVTEMDALVAYLQMLGTLVDFTTFSPDYKR